MIEQGNNCDAADSVQTQVERSLTHFKKLYGRVSKTAAARFNATRRLRMHNAASLWTISLFSLGLILVALLQALSLPMPFSPSIINLVQVFLSITILVISVILTMSNYGLRAERFHACGLEMSEIALKLERVEGVDGSIDEYNMFARQFSDILRRYDNHEQIDFMFMKIQKPQHYPHSRWFTVLVYARFGLQFLPYVVLLGLETLWIYHLLSKIPLTTP